MTLEPLNGIPLISEASKSKLYTFSLDFNKKLLKTSCNDSMQGNF